MNRRQRERVEDLGRAFQDAEGTEQKHREGTLFK
jgi:hypothetical protein